MASQPDPPAEVVPVAEHPEAGIRSADGVPDVATDQRTGQPDGEDVIPAVVLTLVDLVRLDTGDPAPEA